VNQKQRNREVEMSVDGIKNSLRLLMESLENCYSSSPTLEIKFAISGHSNGLKLD